MNIIVQLALKIRDSLNKPSTHQFVETVPMGESIPRCIHQVYFSSTGLPDVIEQNINKLKSMNPGWKYMLYDDEHMENYIKKNYPSLFSTYKKINPIYGAARADFFRYLLMYKEGGVYLDIKSSLMKPLDSIIQENDKYLLSHWKNDIGEIDENKGKYECLSDIPLGEYQQWHIITVKGHPFLKAVINAVCNNINRYNPFFHDTGSWAVYAVTGPVAYTLAIFPHLNSQPHRLERDDSNLDLIYNILPLRNISHHSLFKKHYSVCKEPLILGNPIKNFLFLIISPLLSFLKRKLSKLKHS